MRYPIAWPIVLVLISGACLDATRGERMGTARIRVLPGDALGACFAIEAREGADVWWSIGDAARRYPTLMETAQTGATCGYQIIEEVIACAPGEHTLEVDLIGAYDGSGALADIAEPDAAFTRDFACVAGEETAIDFDLTLMPNAHQGFLNIAIELDTTSPVSNACYALRAENADGQVVYEIPELCSNRFGDGNGLAYVTTCDATTDTNTVTLWLTGLEYVDGRPFDAPSNPCPPGAGAMSAWTDGCALSTRCIENGDVDVEFNLDLPAE